MRPSRLPLAALALALILAPSLCAGVGARLGFLVPQGDIKDLAKTGWRAEVTADLNMFRLPFLSTVVSVGAMDFAEKKSDYTADAQSYTQESHIALTGGGVGLRLQPPAAAISPFAEAMLRLASIEQEYKDGAGNSRLDSRTKFGYQFNAGLQFPLAPRVGLEVGGSYMSFFNNKYLHHGVEREIDLKAFGAFVGLDVGIGL